MGGRRGVRRSRSGGAADDGAHSEGVDPKDLRLQFHTTVQRTTVQLKPHRGTLIEAAIDDGTIKTNARTTTLPIREVEIELKRGNPLALYDAALHLSQQARFRVAVLSKAERGYSLVQRGGEPDLITRAGHVVLDAMMTIDEVLQRIGRRCLCISSSTRRRRSRANPRAFTRCGLQCVVSAPL